MLRMIDYTGLTFQHLQYFITISEQRTMSRAAEILHVSPSLLSQKISQLENIIGIQLFRRLKQRLYLTEAGQQLLMDFRDILFQLNRALDSAREQYSITRPLTIGFTNYQSSRSVEIFLEELHKRFPDISLSAEILPRRRLLEDFEDRKIDIIFVADFEYLRKDKSVISRNVKSVPIGCFVSSSSPLAHRDMLSWKDLEGATCILPEHQNSSAFIRDLKRKINEENVNISIRFHAGDILTTNHLVAHNNYITFAGATSPKDNRLKYFIMDNLQYPFIVAHHADLDPELSAYANALYDIARKCTEPL